MHCFESLNININEKEKEGEVNNNKKGKIEKGNQTDEDDDLHVNKLT